MYALDGKHPSKEIFSIQILGGPWAVKWPLPALTRDATDDELLHLIQEGSERDSQSALETLFVRHHQDVWRYVRSRVSSASDADEVAAAVWLVALEKIYDFVWTGTPIKSWLLSIAHRKTREFFHRPEAVSLETLNDGQDEVLLFLANQLQLIDEPVPVLPERVRKEADILLHKLIARLSDVERKIITLIYFEELENATEVARRLNMNKNTIRVYHKRARDKLRTAPELCRLFEGSG
jgi:RNA polymerase sigma-70 factor (ECF subfamily)